MSNEPNAEVLEQKIGAAYGALGGLLSAAMLHVGDDLGLYGAMNGAGPITSEELASKLELSERFVREWLFQQAASGALEHRGDQTFEMSPEAGLVFADESFPLTMSVVLKYIPKFFSDAVASGEAFRSGLGRNYDAFGEDGARETDAMFGGWNRSSLVGDALPRVGGVVERLQGGGKVADVDELGVGRRVGIEGAWRSLSFLPQTPLVCEPTCLSRV